jgi:hypothetical protein
VKPHLQRNKNTAAGGNMNCLSKDDILSSKDIQIEIVDVPEWGGQLYVRVLSGWQRSKFLKLIAGGKDMPVDWIERLVIACACDADGKALFDEKDLKELQDKNSMAIQRVFDAASKLNGFSDDGRETIAGE